VDAARPAAVGGGGSIGGAGACEVHVRDRRTAETIAHGIRGWDASVARIVDMVDQLRRERDGFRKAVMRLKSEITDLSARARAAGFDSVSSTLYRMAQNLDVKDPYTTALLNQVREVDQEYGTMVRTAGRGLDLPEVFQAIYGNGPSAKAFRSLVNHMKDKWYKTTEDVPPDVQVLATEAMPTVRAIRTSQALKTLIGQYTAFDIPFGEPNPVHFAALLGAGGLRELKRFLTPRVTDRSVPLGGEAKKFLREWVNTNGVRMPTPSALTVSELEPYRPDRTLLLYRGVRFGDVGELVEFTRKYAGTGKPFPFKSKWYSSWTKSISIAERFSRYTSATSHNDAMFGWFSRVKSGKDYDGYGGYIVGARVRPNQCLVDIGNTGVSGQHGNESEVIVLPGQDLVCKVYQVFGDVTSEVEEFRSGYKGQRSPEQFAYGGYEVALVSVDGDIATYRHDPIPRWDGVVTRSTPREESGDEIIGQFRSHLYDAEWIDDHRVRFRPMDLGQGLASAWGRVIVP